MHLSGDLASQVLLGAHQQTRDLRCHRRVGIRSAVGAGGRIDAFERAQIVGDGVAVPRERATLAFQHLDLRLHQRCPFGQRDERVGLLEPVVDVGVLREARELVGRGGSTRLVTPRLGRRLRDQEVDLAELLVQQEQVVGEAGR